MNNNTRHIVALEIGSSKIVGAIAEFTPQGLEVKHLHEERMQNCVRYGNILNIETTRSVINTIVQSLSLSVNGKITEMYIGVSGCGTHSEKYSGYITFPRPQMITSDILSGLNEKAWNSTVEGYRPLAIEPIEFKVNNITQPNPVGCECNQLSAVINRILTRNVSSLNLKRVLSADYKPQFLCTALAVASNITTDDERALGCMIVDLGAETTTVTIFKHNHLIHLATLPIGARHITRDIMALGIPEENAEKVKLNIQNPLEHNAADVIQLEGVKSSDAANYITARTGEIVANIRHQINIAGLQDSDIHNVVLIGGGAQLRGLAQFIESATKISTRNASLPRKIRFANAFNMRQEYIQIASLLIRGSELIQPDNSCVEPNDFNSESGVFSVKQDEKKQQQEEIVVVEEKPKKKSNKFKIFNFSNITDRMAGLLDHNDEEKEDHFEN